MRQLNKQLTPRITEYLQSDDVREVFPAEKTFQAVCDARKQIQRAKDRLAPERWVKSELLRAGSREFCALGAFYDQTQTHESCYESPAFTCLYDANNDAIDILTEVAQELGYDCVPSFNDLENTSFSDVIALFDLALEKADARLEETYYQEHPEEKKNLDA